MAVSTITNVIPYDIKTVWEAVTNVADYELWRSDISKSEVLSDTTFTEQSKDGIVTTFIVTKRAPYERWEFDILNDNIFGHWTGIFKETGEGTEITFTEDVTAKKLLLKPFVAGYLKKQQAMFVLDLNVFLQSMGDSAQ